MMIDRIVSELRFRLRALSRRDEVEQELNEELALHLELETEKLVRRGLSEAEAARQARLSFGGVDRIAEATRDARGIGWLDIARQDIGYAARQLSTDRRYSFIVILTLAIAIGANAAVLPIIDHIFVRPPSGVASPEELMRLYRRHPPSGWGTGFAMGGFPYPAIRNIQSALPADAQLMTYGKRPSPLGRGESSPQPETVSFGPGYFQFLRVHPILGRLPAPEEERMGQALPVALISHREWRQRYGGDSTILGRRIELDYKQFTVIGVLPPAFRGVDVSAADYWIPLGMPRQIQGEPWTESWSIGGTNVVVRARPADHARIAALASSVMARVAPDFMKGVAVTGGTIMSVTGPEKQREEIGVATRLAAVSGILLLIACANIINLNLARSMRRKREISLRLALGISRSRLVALLSVETLLLALMAGIAAFLVSRWAGGLLQAALFPEIVWPESMSGVRVAAFTMAIALVTGLLAGLPPALRAGGFGVAAVLNGSMRQGSDRRSRLRSSLVAAQAGLSVILLVAAGTFIKSLQAVTSIDTGFDVDRLALVTIRFSDFENHDADRAVLMPAVMDRLRTLPGVEMVGGSDQRPLSEHSWVSLFDEAGNELNFENEPPSFQVVTPNFFETAGMRIVAGRAFTESETDPSSPLIVVNEKMAATLWPGRSALGQCLRTTGTSPCARVVGVVETAHRDDLVESEPPAHYYASLAQRPRSRLQTAIIRTRAELLEQVTPVVRDQMRPLLPAGAYPEIQPIAQEFDRELRPWKLGAALFSILGLLALAVAIVGTYSTVAYTVHQRTHEMGVRLALGARAPQVLMLVVAGSVKIVAAGVLFGVLCALALGRFIAAMLYETSPADPSVLGAVSLLLVAAAGIAAFAPAWCAARVDPAIALRTD